MLTTSRIPQPIARATAAFLEMATKWDGMVFAGMLMRGSFEQGTPHGFHLVTWEKLTPQKVADALWKLREEKGDEIAVGGVTLATVIKAWDDMILADHGEGGS